MQLDNLYIHDSIVLSIIENPETDELTFILDWPGENDDKGFTKAELIFENVEVFPPASTAVTLIV